LTPGILSKGFLPLYSLEVATSDSKKRISVSRHFDSANSSSIFITFNSIYVPEMEPKADFRNDYRYASGSAAVDTDISSKQATVLLTNTSDVSTAGLLASGFSPQEAAHVRQLEDQLKILKGENCMLRRRLNGLSILPELMKKKADECRLWKNRAHEAEKHIKLMTPEMHDRSLQDVKLPPSTQLPQGGDDSMKAECHRSLDVSPVTRLQSCSSSMEPSGGSALDLHLLSNGNDDRGAQRALDVFDSPVRSVDTITCSDCQHSLQSTLPRSGLRSSAALMNSSPVRNPELQGTTNATGQLIEARQLIELLKIQVATYMEDCIQEQKKNDRLQRDFDVVCTEKDTAQKRMRQYEDDVFRLQDDNKQLRAQLRRLQSAGACSRDAVVTSTSLLPLQQPPSSAAVQSVPHSMRESSLLICSAPSGSKDVKSTSLNLRQSSLTRASSPLLLQQISSAPTVWSCPVCTFDNQNKQAYCGACGTVRSSTVETSRLQVDSPTSALHYFRQLTYAVG
jgi:hypothetical protein